MDIVLVKVYGFIGPVSEDVFLQLCTSLAPLWGEEKTSESVSFEKSCLNISYEGVYFPLEDVLMLLENSIKQGAAGKIDYIDLEVWALTRNLFGEGKISSSTRDLNQILEYSGH